jgi:hypothetical protein
MKTIIEMAREAGFVEYELEDYTQSGYDIRYERFAALVRADEREKSLQLWMLLDDVDTADDIAKTDEAIYRSLCRQAHAKRWSLLNGDEVDAAIRARGQA